MDFAAFSNSETLTQSLLASTLSPAGIGSYAYRANIGRFPHNIRHLAVTISAECDMKTGKPVLRIIWPRTQPAPSLNPLKTPLDSTGDWFNTELERMQ